METTPEDNDGLVPPDDELPHVTTLPSDFNAANA
jgi:hypothetical protein